MRVLESTAKEKKVEDSAVTTPATTGDTSQGVQQTSEPDHLKPDHDDVDET
ncbi:hypothetical protein HORIV_68260 [Vreelandella olivaria]|uniref:Uncharacterized protein n=1 Tax=Vreelandella olivaria TaxID=390919 RepID=A0ABM7GUH8_9GAMM|nr:hypothetical protein HORIV_68260 [Halomonas olivaria]